MHRDLASPASLPVPSTGSFFSDSQSGLIPSKWRRSTVIPDPKKQCGVVFVADRFRGIALTSAVCKGFSDVLNERLVTYCGGGVYNLIVEEQGGFRRDS